MRNLTRLSTFPARTDVPMTSPSSHPLLSLGVPRARPWNPILHRCGAASRPRLVDPAMAMASLTVGALKSQPHRPWAALSTSSGSSALGLSALVAMMALHAGASASTKPGRSLSLISPSDNGSAMIFIHKIEDHRAGERHGGRTGCGTGRADAAGGRP